MNDMPTRREAVVAAAAIAAAVGVDKKPHVDAVAVWEAETCPGCDLPVYFLPGQHLNRCGHCRTRVVH